MHVDDAPTDRSSRSGQRAAVEGDQIASTPLRAGALGAGALTLQAITNVSPAAAVFFSFGFTASLAGVVTPWAYILTAVIVLMTAVALAELAKAFPSAGGYFTYISAGLNPQLGFMAAWAFVLFMPPVAGVVLGYLGFLLHDELARAYGVTIPWWVYAVAGGVVAFTVVYRGIRPSVRLLAVLTLIELVIVLALSLWGFFEPGPGGLTLAPLDPSNFGTAPNLFLAVVFSIFAFAGWEGAVPLAEEARNPDRTVPRALVLSVCFFAGLFAVCSTGLLTGWGVARVDAIGSSDAMPPLVLAHRFWHGLWWVVLLALVNTVLANAVAALTVSTRMTFAMARSGLLPSWLAHVQPRTMSPRNAIHVQVGLFFVFGFGGAMLVGISRLYFFFGFVVTFVLAFIYVLGNIAVVRHYRPGRPHFNVLRHAVFPVLSTAAICVLVFKTLSPYPPHPYNWALPLTVVWLAIGAVVLMAILSRGPNTWKAAAARAAELVPAGREERSLVYEET